MSVPHSDGMVTYFACGGRYTKWKCNKVAGTKYTHTLKWGYIKLEKKPE